jgi:hypothetical protein
VIFRLAIGAVRPATAEEDTPSVAGALHEAPVPKTAPSASAAETTKPSPDTGRESASTARGAVPRRTPPAHRNPRTHGHR